MTEHQNQSVFSTGFKIFLERSLIMRYDENLKSLFDIAGRLVLTPSLPDDYEDFFLQNTSFANTTLMVFHDKNPIQTMKSENTEGLKSENEQFNSKNEMEFKFTINEPVLSQNFLPSNSSIENLPEAELPVRISNLLVNNGFNFSENAKSQISHQKMISSNNLNSIKKPNNMRSLAESHSQLEPFPEKSKSKNDIQVGRISRLELSLAVETLKGKIDTKLKKKSKINLFSENEQERKLKKLSSKLNSFDKDNESANQEEDLISRQVLYQSIEKVSKSNENELNINVSNQDDLSQNTHLNHESIKCLDVEESLNSFKKRSNRKSNIMSAADINKANVDANKYGQKSVQELKKMRFVKADSQDDFLKNLENNAKGNKISSISNEDKLINRKSESIGIIKNVLEIINEERNEGDGLLEQNINNENIFEIIDHSKVNFQKNEHKMIKNKNIFEKKNEIEEIEIENNNNSQKNTELMQNCEEIGSFEKLDLKNDTNFNKNLENKDLSINNQSFDENIIKIKDQEVEEKLLKNDKTDKKTAILQNDHEIQTKSHNCNNDKTNPLVENKNEYQKNDENINSLEKNKNMIETKNNVVLKTNENKKDKQKDSNIENKQEKSEQNLNLDKKSSFAEERLEQINFRDLKSRESIVSINKLESKHDFSKKNDIYQKLDSKNDIQKNSKDQKISKNQNIIKQIEKTTDQKKLSLSNIDVDNNLDEQIEKKSIINNDIDKNSHILDFSNKKSKNNENINLKEISPKKDLFHKIDNNLPNEYQIHVESELNKSPSQNQESINHEKKNSKSLQNSNLINKNTISHSKDQKLINSSEKATFNQLSENKYNNSSNNQNQLKIDTNNENEIRLFSSKGVKNHQISNTKKEVAIDDNNSSFQKNDHQLLKPTFEQNIENFDKISEKNDQKHKSIQQSPSNLSKSKSKNMSKREMSETLKFSIKSGDASNFKIETNEINYEKSQKRTSGKKNNIKKENEEKNWAKRQFNEELFQTNQNLNEKSDILLKSLNKKNKSEKSKKSNFINSEKKDDQIKKSFQNSQNSLQNNNSDDQLIDSEENFNKSNKNDENKQKSAKKNLKIENENKHLSKLSINQFIVKTPSKSNKSCKSVQKEAQFQSNKKHQTEKNCNIENDDLSQNLKNSSIKKDKKSSKAGVLVEENDEITKKISEIMKKESFFPNQLDSQFQEKLQKIDKNEKSTNIPLENEKSLKSQKITNISEKKPFSSSVQKSKKILLLNKIANRVRPESNLLINDVISNLNNELKSISLTKQSISREKLALKNIELQAKNQIFPKLAYEKSKTKNKKNNETNENEKNNVMAFKIKASKILLKNDPRQNQLFDQKYVHQNDSGKNYNNKFFTKAEQDFFNVNSAKNRLKIEKNPLKVYSDTYCLNEIKHIKQKREKSHISDSSKKIKPENENYKTPTKNDGSKRIYSSLSKYKNSSGFHKNSSKKSIRYFLTNSKTKSNQEKQNSKYVTKTIKKNGFQENIQKFEYRGIVTKNDVNQPSKNINFSLNDQNQGLKINTYKDEQKYVLEEKSNQNNFKNQHQNNISLNFVSKNKNDMNLNIHLTVVLDAKNQISSLKEEKIKEQIILPITQTFQLPKIVKNEQSIANNNFLKEKNNLKNNDLANINPKSANDHILNNFLNFSQKENIRVSSKNVNKKNIKLQKNENIFTGSATSNVLKEEKDAKFNKNENISQQMSEKIEKNQMQFSQNRTDKILSHKFEETDNSFFIPVKKGMNKLQTYKIVRKDSQTTNRQNLNFPEKNKNVNIPKTQKMVSPYGLESSNNFLKKHFDMEIKVFDKKSTSVSKTNTSTRFKIVKKKQKVGS